MTAGKGDDTGKAGAASDQSVETIRDILFGDAVRGLNGQLEALSTRVDESVDALREEARGLLEDLKRDLSREQEAREAALSTLGHELGEKLELRAKELEREAAALRDSQETGRKDLAKLFRRLADSLDAEGDA